MRLTLGSFGETVCVPIVSLFSFLTSPTKWGSYGIIVRRLLRVVMRANQQHASEGPGGSILPIDPPPSNTNHL